MCVRLNSVKTKNPDKTFRLASELTGMEGMVEATTWEQVLCMMCMCFMCVRCVWVMYALL